MEITLIRLFLADINVFLNKFYVNWNAMWRSFLTSLNYNLSTFERRRSWKDMDVYIINFIYTIQSSLLIFPLFSLLTLTINVKLKNNEEFNRSHITHKLLNNIYQGKFEWEPKVNRIWFFIFI